jgi:hypothetical protein
MLGELPRRCQNDLCTKMQSATSNRKHRTRKRVDGRPDCMCIHGMTPIVEEQKKAGGIFRLTQHINKKGLLELRHNHRINAKETPSYACRDDAVSSLNHLLRHRVGLLRRRTKNKVKHVRAQRTSVSLQRIPVVAAPLLSFHVASAHSGDDASKHETHAVVSEDGLYARIAQVLPISSTNSLVEGEMRRDDSVSTSSLSSICASGISVSFNDPFLHRVNEFIMAAATCRFVDGCPLAQRIRCTSTAVHIMQRLTQTMSAEMFFHKLRARYGDEVLASSFADVIFKLEGVLPDASKQALTSGTNKKAMILQSWFVNILGDSSCL